MKEVAMWASLISPSDFTGWTFPLLPTRGLGVIRPRGEHVRKSILVPGAIDDGTGHTPAAKIGQHTGVGD
jgi:hypothetical protein